MPSSVYLVARPNNSGYLSLRFAMCKRHFAPQGLAKIPRLNFANLVLFRAQDRNEVWILFRTLSCTRAFLHRSHLTEAKVSDGRFRSQMS